MEIGSPIPSSLMRHYDEARKLANTHYENFPVASLLVESAAPGCERWTREYRLVEGLDHLEIVNVLDKRAVREKEGVHLGFAFHVPDGEMHVNIPWAVIRPEKDQMPGACKNWLCVGRWVDVSNATSGVTCAVLDAPEEAAVLSRMRLCDLTARTLKIGLALLGIDVLERM